ncbi:S-adenosyl-L-methionine-dependent methyltransferase, partial [Jimgerdemannia flammicorona]
MTEDTSGDTSPVPEGFKVDHRRRKLFHGNFNAPVEDALSHGIKVLDAGCGAGCWTMNMANDFPNSHFVGVDVADLFPKDEVKSNCIFVKANTLEGLPFEDDTFDYIFQRFMVLAFTPADWAKAISELVRVTKPGGWVELVESDCKLEQAPPSYLKFQNA